MSFKKSQISIFIIVSLILAIIAIFLIYTNSSSIKIFNDEKSSYKVKEFVESCLEKETKIAQREIGLKAGWLYHPDLFFANKNTNKYIIKNARGYEDLGGVQIPYWYYYDDTKEKFRFNIPSYDLDNDKYSIKNQLKRYIEENLDKDCLMGFRNFDAVYDIKYEPRKVIVDVDLERENIKVSMKLPIQINEKNTNNTEFISKFSTQIDNKLYIPYHLAKDITIAQANSSFIEKRILNFINPYQTASRKDLLPPFYDFQLKYDFNPWYVPEVEKKFKQILSSNIGYLQFYNTDYKIRTLPKELKNNDFANKVNTNYLKDYLTEYVKTDDEDEELFKSYKDYSVKPSYEVFYPTFFSIAPSYGDILLMPRPQAFINLIPIFFTEYNAVYEITTPILFQIKNSKLKNDDFVFNLLIEANIDHNLPKKENIDFDFNPNEVKLDERNSLICNPNQFISKKIYLNLTDNVNHGKVRYDDLVHKVVNTAGIDDAMITFDCKGITTCFIGMTKANGRYRAENKTELEFRLPINCYPGRLEIYKYGYKKVVIDNLDPNLENEINLGEIYMPSKKRFNLSIKLINGGESVYSTGRTLKKYESGLLIIENLEDKNDVSVIEFNKSNINDLSVELMPANYSIKGFVFYNNNFTIPKEKVCYKKSFWSKKKCVDIPKLELSSWVVGSYDYKNFEVINRNILYDGNLVIPMLNFGVPKSYSDMTSKSEVMSNVQGYSLKPYFEEK